MEKLKRQDKIIASWTGDLTTPLVSICCPTFNHEKYIQDTIEGFLTQKTTFPFEIIIRDDDSKDRTPIVLREIEKQFPKIIRVIFESENQYSKGVKVIPVMGQVAKGKYIAFCDGDDYWTDPLKLQKQVDFLENNEDFAITHHKTDLFKNDKIEPDDLNINTPEITTINDLAKGNYIRTLSVLFRKPKCKEFFAKLPNCPIGDFPLYLIILDHFQGKIKYFPETMGVYRINENGVYEKYSLKHKRNMYGETLKKILESNILTSKEIVERLKINHHSTYWTLFKGEQDKEKRLYYLKCAIEYSDKNIQDMMGVIDSINNNILFQSYRRLKTIFSNFLKKVLDKR